MENKQDTYLFAFDKKNEEVKNFFDRIAEKRDTWKKWNSYYYREHYKYLRFLISENQRVLVLGSSTGQLLNELKPFYGVGVDISEKMIEIARKKYPSLTWIHGDIEAPDVLLGIKGPFDYIVLSGTLGYIKDCQEVFNRLHRLCNRNTRLVINYYSWLWDPILFIGEKLRLKMPQIDRNWLSSKSIRGILKLEDYDTVKTEWRQLVPFNFIGLGYLINRYIATLPVLRRFCLMHYVVARSLRHQGLLNPSVSIIIPCKNEAGNIEPAVRRIPKTIGPTEIIFVEGGSKDNTAEEILRVKSYYTDFDIKFVRQQGKGKWNAVKEGFACATGEVLMILDADLTMPPEELSKFYIAIKDGKGEFVHGTRMVYPQEKDAMQTLNRYANSIFSIIFTWLLNEHFTDTLCGTKVLTRENWLRIDNECNYFGKFDPFGDFYLIFGAYKQNLKIVEIPIRYRAREYGKTQISRFRHGLYLMRMVGFAFRKLKALN